MKIITTTIIMTGQHQQHIIGSPSRQDRRQINDDGITPLNSPTTGDSYHPLHHEHEHNDHVVVRKNALHHDER